MFYVVGKKIYNAQFDAVKGCYPEVVLKATAEGAVYPEVQPTGLKEPPKKYRLCCLREVLAQYGSMATVEPAKTE